MNLYDVKNRGTKKVLNSFSNKEEAKVFRNAANKDVDYNAENDPNGNNMPYIVSKNPSHPKYK